MLSIEDFFSVTVSEYEYRYNFNTIPDFFPPHFIHDQLSIPLQRKKLFYFSSQHSLFIPTEKHYCF